MKSIVIELQRLSTDDNIAITALLRKALIVASKLNLSDFKKWIENELGGYEEVKDIPAYRRVSGEIKCWNPYNGIWMPLIGKGVPKELTSRAIGQSISEIEDIYNDKRQNGFLQVPFSQEQAAILIEAFDMPTLPTLIISGSFIAGIIDSVRNIILKWSLKLETEGILGEDMSFSGEEKKKATNNPEIRIKNFQGILGSVVNSSITQDMHLDVRKDDLSSLLKYLSSQGIEEEELTELGKAIQADPKPKSKDNLGRQVSAWIGKMVQKAASGVWKIGLTAAGNILAKAICAYYGI